MSTDEISTANDIPESKENNRSFFEFLKDSKLQFSTEAVEDFLLSLKAKQFLILSGGTGTGKTRLAKAYGEYISTFEPKTIDVTVKIGKVKDNNGFTLSRDQFFNNLPPSLNKLDGKYEFSIEEMKGKGKIDITPRFWFDRDDPDREKILQKLDALKSEKERTTLTIKMPSLDPGSMNYLIVPVGSNWTDNRHIIGYRNAITGSYSGTPSLDFIIRSNKFITQPFLLVLDEMNLSHVERYFSDVISCIESGEDILLDTDNSENIPESVTLDDNLFIIGTVNMDETTYMFSPKVLDRANVIEFEPVSISDCLSSDSAADKPTGDVKFLQDCMSGLECRSMSYTDIINEMKSKGNEEFIKSLVSDLDSIQKFMISMKLPFGFRTLDEIMRFMYVAWIYEGRGLFENWKRYFDSQIRQKIIPKIHGNSSISAPLKELKVFCDSNGYGKSASKLGKMEAVLDSQRYVSFNC